MITPSQDNARTGRQPSIMGSVIPVLKLKTGRSVGFNTAVVGWLVCDGGCVWFERKCCLLLLRAVREVTGKSDARSASHLYDLV